MARPLSRVVLAVGVLATALAAVTSPAKAAVGPRLQEPAPALEQALRCGGEVFPPGQRPVLLVHGTWTNPEESWRWGYERALPDARFPTCTVALPDSSLGDVQRSSEYVVHAVRRISSMSGGKIAVIGHSQGALDVLWALRFWPDLPRRVSDFIGLAGVHSHWTLQEDCASGCPFQFESAWQMTRGSRLLDALHQRALPPGPAYTSIATEFDAIVSPEGAHLSGARNVLIQHLCAGRPIDHIAMLGDAVAYALVLDALRHDGPADPARVPLSTCLELALPGFDPSGAAAAVSPFASTFARSVAVRAEREPELRCYARESCQGAGAG